MRFLMNESRSTYFDYFGDVERTEYRWLVHTLIGRTPYRKALAIL